MKNLQKADGFAAELKKGVDMFIDKAGLDAPEDNSEELKDGYDSDIITDLDLESEGINTIIWASGYKFDFSWVEFPIYDEFGYPGQKRGVTSQPGLYFLGLHWLHTITSGLFFGVGDDAAHIAEHINGRS